MLLDSFRLWLGDRLFGPFWQADERLLPGAALAWRLDGLLRDGPLARRAAASVIEGENVVTRTALEER